MGRSTVKAALRRAGARIFLPFKIVRNRIRALVSRRRRATHARKVGPEALPWRTLDLRDWRRLKVRLVSVSLLDRPEHEPRRRLFQKHARRHGWEVSFWPGVDGQKLETVPSWVSLVRPSGPEPMKPGEIGQAVAIRKLYQWALDEGLEHLVIFEDDAVIHAPPRVEVPEEYDLVFLNDLFYGDAEGRLKVGWGNYAYMVSRRGLEKMLRIMTRVEEPLDLLMVMYCRSTGDYGSHLAQYRDPNMPQLDCYHFGPLATHAGYFKSSIRGGANDA